MLIDARFSRTLVVAVSLMTFGFVACVGDDPSSGGNSGEADASTGGDGASGGDGSAGGDGSSGGDAAIAPPCNSTADFQAPTAVAGLEVVGSVARFSQDEKIAYFTYGTDAGVPHLAHASRSGLSSAFGAPVPFTELQIGVAGELHPSVSANGLTIYFTAFGGLDGGTTGNEIVYAQRANVAADFGVSIPVPGVNTDFVEEEPFVANSGDLWFATDRDSVGVDHLYRALNVGAGFGPAAPSDVNSVAPTSDQYPVLSNDGLTLYFSRKGGASATHVVWSATRTIATGPFSAPAVVPNVSSVDGDRPGWLSADGCRLYMAEGGTGGALKIVVASKPAK